MLPDFPNGQQILSYMHSVFKIYPCIDMMVREMGDGIRGEFGIGENCSAARMSEALYSVRYSSGKTRKKKKMTV